MVTDNLVDWCLFNQSRGAVIEIVHWNVIKTEVFNPVQTGFLGPPRARGVWGGGDDPKLQKLESKQLVQESFLWVRNLRG